VRGAHLPSGSPVGRPQKTSMGRRVCADKAEFRSSHRGETDHMPKNIRPTNQASAIAAMDTFKPGMRAGSLAP
jgi:hypothetical protein